MADEGAPAWQVHVTQGDGVVVVHVDGELDIATAPRLRELLADLRRTRGPVVLDARGLRFLDVSGMRLLAHERARRAREGGGLTIASPTTGVRRALLAAGLRSLLSDEPPARAPQALPA